MASKRAVLKNKDTQQYELVGSLEVLSGVTSLITKYKTPFDPIAASIAYAEKHGQTPEYWRKLWDMKWNYRKLVGNTFHNSKETVEGGASIGKSTSGALLEVRNSNLYIDSGVHTADLPDGIYLELPLYHYGFNASGTPDKIIIETVEEVNEAGKKVKVRYVDVVDYKTNEKIEEESYQYKRSGNYKRMQFPLHNLMDCSLVHISLQVSLYAYFLECMGLTPRKLLIEHYKYDLKEEDILAGRILDVTETNAMFEKQYVVDYWEYKEHVVNLLYHEYNTRRRKNREAENTDTLEVQRKL